MQDTQKLNNIKIKNYNVSFVNNDSIDIIKKFKKFFYEFEEIKKKEDFKCFVKPIDQSPYFSFIGIQNDIEFVISFGVTIDTKGMLINLSVFYEVK
jgi:hypothetical protein